MPSFIESALVNQAKKIAEKASAFRKYQEAVAASNSLSLPQYGALFAMILEFKPDLILDFGRARGNFTCVAAEACGELDGKARIASYCITDEWRGHTLPRLKALGLRDSWFAPIDAKVADLTALDYAALVSGCHRVFCFWDAHTYEIADAVLGKLMPLLADRPHVVAVHDISDNRYANSDRDYRGKSLWRGTDDFYANQDRTAFLNVFWMTFVNDMLLSVADFCWRNRIELHSVDHELQQALMGDPAALARLEGVIPDDFLKPVFQFAYYSLNEGEAPFRFPAVLSKRRRPGSPLLQGLRLRLRRLIP